jgi:hypothetical protein
MGGIAVGHRAGARYRWNRHGRRRVGPEGLTIVPLGWLGLGDYERPPCIHLINVRTVSRHIGLGLDDVRILGRSGQGEKEYQK